MSEEFTFTLEDIKAAAKKAEEYFELRVSLERERLMGFFNKPRLREVFEFSKRHEEWSAEIDKLPNPDPKRFFDAGHSKRYLKWTTRVLIDYAEKSPRYTADNFVQGLVNCMIELERLIETQRSQKAHEVTPDRNITTDEISINALEYFAEQLGCKNAVQAKISQILTQRLR